MEDITLKCVACKKDFVHPVHEQKFFADKDWTPPKRCRECRARRRDEQAAKEEVAETETGYSMDGLSLCCGARMVNGGRQCEACGGPGL